MDENRLDELIQLASDRACGLPATSPTRLVASDEWLTGLARSPVDAVGPDGSLPPLLLHLVRRELGEVLAVDEDIALVRTHAPRPSEVGRFLKFGRSFNRNDVRQWVAGRVELALHAHLMACLPLDSVTIEPLLPNGKRADAAVRIKDRWVWVECTALSNADADSEDLTTMGAKWGDPYYDACRIYRKAFDKIAGPVTDMRSQLNPDEPSVLLLTDATWISPGFYSLGARWAVEQLTRPCARSDSSRASVVTWAHRDYGEQAVEALDGLASMSALAVLSYDLRTARVAANAGCGASHVLTPQELSALATMLCLDRTWLQ